ncbi:MAG: hypothetical protein EOM20_01295 [Spartobacteria bacterium]|nr:hypothetical protein [Spartobacteria bacterium]
MKILKVSGIVVLMACMALMTAGCASPWVKIAPEVGLNARDLGAVTGTAHGQLFSPGAGTAYYFWPIMLNSRIERAYNEALSSSPSATALEKVTIQERWYWWVLVLVKTLFDENGARKNHYI